MSPENNTGLQAVITDVDGTITDQYRRIHTGAIQAIRQLLDSGIEVVLASGNTACFMDALSRMIGTSGSFIAENGGVFRIIYGGELTVIGDQSVCKEALDALIRHFRKKGVELELYSPDYRLADLAFAKTVRVSEVREVVKPYDVNVLDTGFAIHLQSPGVSKGTAFSLLAREMDIGQSSFMAIGDAQNDIELLKAAGIGIAVKNAHPDAASAADWVSEKSYGDGFVEAIQRYSSYFRER
ncbi:MAG TPA: phosphoglycolate phosphatase [Methanoregulaceae archaeon]|nr:phosphoglycolate phosphatase [Methanoregulaceae archaeon]